MTGYHHTTTVLEGRLMEMAYINSKVNPTDKYFMLPEALAAAAAAKINGASSDPTDWGSHSF